MDNHGDLRETYAADKRTTTMGTTEKEISALERAANKRMGDFDKWMARIGNIHTANKSAMFRAYSKILNLET